MRRHQAAQAALSFARAVQAAHDDAEATGIGHEAVAGVLAVSPDEATFTQRWRALRQWWLVGREAEQRRRTGRPMPSTVQ